ncbi:MAG: M81 family metallopeptidase [Pirellulales bacterium]|nr:M81 family metallopeptidase [Pirellulales bacterium]
MRVGIIALLQESNTFIAQRTQIGHFQSDLLATGGEIRKRFAGAHHEVSGFLSGLDDAGIEAVPIFAARAVPYGVIAADAWQFLMSMLRAALDQAGPLDGVLVAPHGATVSEPEPDADGFWLAELRHRLGPNIPIIGTLDPHANLSPRMVHATDALIAYRTNPHIDQWESGRKAASLMARTLRGEVRPTQAAAFPPVVINIECQETAVSPCRHLYAAADAQLQRAGVLSNSILLGFAYADVLEMGSAMLAVTDNNQRFAQQLADELAAQLWRQRNDFVGRPNSVAAAIEQAKGLDGPVCLLDTGDNIGGGSPGDGTWIAQELHRRQIDRALVCLCDAATVAQCETHRAGEKVRLRVGGGSGPLQGQPLAADFSLVDLRDGRFEESAARHGGCSQFDQGRTAILRTDAGLTLLVGSQRVPPFSLGQITSCGLDPSQFQILVAKGVVAPMAAYRPVCRHFIRVTTPGVTTTDLSQVQYQQRRRPLFPFETDFEWNASNQLAATFP